MARALHLLSLLALLLAACAWHASAAGERLYNAGSSTKMVSVSGNDCMASCKKIGSGWRSVNGGSIHTALCAYDIYLGTKNDGANPACRYGLGYDSKYGKLGKNYKCICTNDVNNNRLKWISKKDGAVYGYDASDCLRPYTIAPMYSSAKYLICRNSKGAMGWLSTPTMCVTPSAPFKPAAILCKK